jgi:hypothetical protein
MYVRRQWYPLQDHSQQRETWQRQGAAVEIFPFRKFEIHLLARQYYLP